MKCRLTRVGIGRSGDASSSSISAARFQRAVLMPGSVTGRRLVGRRMGCRSAASAGRLLDRSSIVCRPEVRSVWSGSATTIPSMRRPASSTATATRASSWSVAVAAADGEQGGVAGRRVSQVGKPALHDDQEDRQVDLLAVRHLADETGSVGPAPSRSVAQAAHRLGARIMTDGGHQTGDDAQRRGERRELRSDRQASPVAGERHHGERLRMVHPAGDAGLPLRSAGPDRAAPGAAPTTPPASPDSARAASTTRPPTAAV